MKDLSAVVPVGAVAARFVRGFIAVCACVGVLLTLGCDEGGGHRTAAAPTGTAASPAAASPLSFARPKTYPVGDWPQAAAIGDLNGDGKPDLVTPNRDAATISVLINRGRGNFESERRYRVGGEPSSVAVGDVNGDRDPDVVTTNGEASTISVLLNSGDGTLERKRDYRTGYDPNAVALGDLNGDHDLDVVTANFGDGTVSAFLNTGDGAFKGRIVYRAQGTLISVGVADLNGDGNADVVLTDAADHIFVLLNDGDGAFPEKTEYEPGPNPVVAIGDVNGDAKPDLAIATEDSTASVLMNKGDGSFRAAAAYATGASSRAATMCVRCVAIGDVNGDGTQDVVTANQAADTVSVLANNGDGHFRRHLDYEAGTEPRSVAIGDLNGDGRADLVAASAGNTVSVLINNSGATRKPPRTARAARPRGTVVFAANRSGNFEIYSVHADGSNLGQLTLSRGEDTSPIFSADGRRLAYICGDEGSLDNLCVASADGSDKRRLASFVHDPVWAPDGMRIAYTDLDGRLAISTIDGDHRVVFRGESHRPSWSPDGKQLVFTTGYDRLDLAVVREDGRGLTRIRRGIGMAGAVWSPRGDLIAVPVRDGALAVVTPEGRGIRRVAWKADAFAWSPDGRRIAFVAGGRLYVVRADAGSPRDVTPASAGPLDTPAWSPGGRWLAVASLRPGELFHGLLVVAADGTSSRRITSRIPKPYGSENLSPTWWPQTASRARLGGAPVAPLPSETVSASVYDTAGPIQSFAADGVRAIVVFYPQIGSCASVAVWEPRRRRVVRLQRPCLAGEESIREGTGPAALAGTRAAWLRTAGGNTLEQYLETATLVRPAPVEIADAYAEEGVYGDFLRNPVGDSSVLAFTRERRCAQFEEAREYRCPPGRKPGAVVDAEILRIAQGPHVVGVARAKGKLSVLAVDAGRIAARTDRGVRLLNADGDLIRDFDVRARQAALSGKWLAVRTTNAVEIYDVDSGQRARRFPAARHLRLEDLEGDIVVTASGPTVTLRRLRDGRTATIHTAGAALAQLEPAGLFVAGTRRVSFTPMSEVLRRFGVASPGR